MEPTAPLTSARSHSKRLNFRVAKDQKSLIEQAAAASCQTVSAFAVSHLVADARVVLRDEEAVIRSARDRERFLTLIESPPEPNEALRKGAELYRRQRV